MFNFGRKKEKDEKEKKKKDKKERKKQYIDSMSQDELTRLEELRKSLGSKSVSPEKLSGITADYRDQEQESTGSISSKSSSSLSLNRPTSLISPSATSSSSMIPPPLPARPPPKIIQKKSILKSSKSYDVSRSVSSDLDDANVLFRNTKENAEYINVIKKMGLSPQKSENSTASSTSGNSGNEFQDREVPFEMAQATVKVRAHSDHVSPVSHDILQ